MNVTLCSHFRNAANYIPRYFAQVDALRRVLEGNGNTFTLIVAEGDSADRTPEALYDALAEGQYKGWLLDVPHGGQDYGSIVHPERFANLAKVCNALWERLPANADAVVFCESDLTWEPSVMLALIDRLKNYPAISPMIMLRRDGYPPNFHYDTWAYRKNGISFSPVPPYFDGWERDSKEPVQLSSAGSCMAMRGELARKVYWPPEDVFVGLSRLLYEQGGSVWLDPNLQVTHE